MTPLEREKGKFRRRRTGGRAIPPVTVATQPQTHEEECQFKAAFRLFLVAIVRQQLERQKE